MNNDFESISTILRNDKQLERITMKQYLILLLSFFVINCLKAGTMHQLINVDLSIAIAGYESEYLFIFEKNGEQYDLYENNYMIKVTLISSDENGCILQAAIYEDCVLVTQPTLVTTWNELGIVKFGNTGNDIIVKVTATRTDHITSDITN